jgi:hypothetical protein
MKKLLGTLALTAAPDAFAWRGGAAVYHGPAGGTAVRGPGGGVPSEVRGVPGQRVARGAALLPVAAIITEARS